MAAITDGNHNIGLPNGSNMACNMSFSTFLRSRNAIEDILQL